MVWGDYDSPILVGFPIRSFSQGTILDTSLCVAPKLNGDALDLVERDLVRSVVVELGGARALVGGDAWAPSMLPPFSARRIHQGIAVPSRW